MSGHYSLATIVAAAKIVKFIDDNGIEVLNVARFWYTGSVRFMQIEIKHPAFKSHRLSVETASILAGPKLLLNGVVVKRTGRSYLVRSDTGQVGDDGLARFRSGANIRLGR